MTKDEVRKALDSLAIAAESVKRAARATATAFAPLRAWTERWAAHADADDRLYARRYLRAQKRSRRNTNGPQRRAHGRPR